MVLPFQKAVVVRKIRFVGQYLKKSAFITDYAQSNVRRKQPIYELTPNAGL